MEKTKIRFNPLSDTRNLNKNNIPTKEEIKLARQLHKENVQKVMLELLKVLQYKMIIHDHTFDERFDDYYDTFVETLKSGDDETFRNSEIFKYHISQEHHHLLEGPRPDTDTFTNLAECLVDRVVSSLETANETPDIPLDKDYVYQVYLNTIEYLKSHIEVTL